MSSEQKLMTHLASNEAEHIQRKGILEVLMQRDDINHERCGSQKLRKLEELFAWRSQRAEREEHANPGKDTTHILQPAGSCLSGFAFNHFVLPQQRLAILKLRRQHGKHGVSLIRAAGQGFPPGSRHGKRSLVAPRPNAAHGNRSLVEALTVPVAVSSSRAQEANVDMSCARNTIPSHNTCNENNDSRNRSQSNGCTFRTHPTPC
mmetsp:Transcript_15847/g.37484  ORF Transcript_15847/g.37484 Transcript_15847/m.37484 type:complete len:205 (-) Transcript_15847:49-663(-)